MLKALGIYEADDFYFEIEAFYSTYPDTWRINLPDLMWRTGADGWAPEKSLGVLEEVVWYLGGGAHPSIQDQGKGGALYVLPVVASIGHSETFNSCPKLWVNVSVHC